MLTTHTSYIFSMWEDFILLDSHIYTQQFLIYLWVHHHNATLPLKRKPFMDLMGYLQDHLWIMWVFICTMLLCLYSIKSSCACAMNIFAPSPGTIVSILVPMPWIFFLVTIIQAHNHEHFSFTLKTLIHACTFFVRTLRTFFCACATLPYHTLLSALILLVREIDTLKNLLVSS